MIIRKAEDGDVGRIAGIYERILEKERRGEYTTGWLPGVYPVRATAERALAAGELFAAEENGAVVGSAIFNRRQGDSYRQGNWLYPCGDDEAMVMHTLTVDPAYAGRGCARAFLTFYEDYARENGCPVLRIDTQEKNAAARTMYRRHGYREAGIVLCGFNGIPDVHLVLLEKKL